MTYNQDWNSARLPKDDGWNTMQLLPDVSPLAVTYSAGITNSTTELTLNANTKQIHIAVEWQGVFIKYGTDDATTSDFDAYAIPGSYIDRRLPDWTTAINVITATGTASAFVLIEY